MANTLAAFALELRNQTDIVPDLYFDWSELSPLHNQLRFLFAGVGEIAPFTREILRRAEPDQPTRPRTHVA